MRKVALLVCVMTTCAVITGCAYDGRSHGYVEAGIGPYDGYYDDYYGPFYDGYWASDGAFYYRDHRIHKFRRDDGGHFRREASEGFHGFRGKLNPEHHEQ